MKMYLMQLIIEEVSVCALGELNACQSDRCTLRHRHILCEEQRDFANLRRPWVVIYRRQIAKAGLLKEEQCVSSQFTALSPIKGL